MVVGTLLLAFAGCTPPDEGGFAALRISKGGDLEVLTAFCEGEVLDHAGVFTQGEKEEAYWRVFVPFEHRSSEISSFTLFDAPPEWEVSEQGKIEPTRPGVLYGIAVTTSGYSLGDGGTRSRVTGLNFTTEDLDRLGTDEVLVTTETYEAVPMSEGDFYAQGRKSC